jgi:crotonobetainyl-CoA:carnitine CoA-transferase CaiB-like acyl-CoA transferase
MLSRLNPRLIVANLSGYGRNGPEKDLPGYEGISYFSRSGIMHTLQVPGLPPPQYPVGMCDFPAGMVLAYGIMLALFIRERTGVGQEVDTSLFNSGVYALSNAIAGALVTGQEREKVARADVLNPLAGYYETLDHRWVRIGMVQPDLYWFRFCQAIARQDLEHDPRFATFDPRIEHHAALFKILVEVFNTRTYADWKTRLSAAGLPWGPVQNLPELIHDAQDRANDMFIPLEHPVHGRMDVVNSPVRLSKTPLAPLQASAQLGQHTEEALLAYGYTWDDIARFKDEGVIW